MTKQDFITQFNFFNIGSYTSQDGTVVRHKIGKHIKQSLVYAMFVDGVCMYIGKSVAGTGRPLSYHKNNVMINVRDGIRSVIAEGKTVEVYVKTCNLSVDHHGLTLNIAEALEQALISKNSPAWNRYKHK